MDVFGLVDIPLWSILLILCLSLLYIYGAYPMNTWHKLGVPGPKPLPFIGNTHQLQSSPHGVQHAIHNLIQQYGKVFGLYFFRIRCLVVADVRGLKEVFVKDFSNYADRFHIGNGGFLPPSVMNSLFFQNGVDWKRNRRILSPTFTSGKLKLITHYVNITARQLTQVLQRHADNNVQPLAKNLFGAYSLDVIGGTTFGLDLDSLNNPDSIFLNHAKRIFELKTSIKIGMALASIFPFFGFILHRLDMSIMDLEGVEFYRQQITKLVMERKSNPESFKQADFLQLLLKAEMDTDDINMVVGDKKLTTEEVISQGIVFMIAGYETTATALQFTTYLVAKHHHVQERMLEEIKRVVGDQDEVSYEMCQHLKYLEAVLNESLRIYPPIASINRTSLKSTQLLGFPVPANTVISIDIFNINRDPEVYDDPDTFNPDRFLVDSENKITGSVSFLPFGFGPRQCIGMRLAMMEMKIALVHMLRKVVLVDASPDNLQLDDYTGMLSARVPIQLSLAHR